MCRQTKRRKKKQKMDLFETFTKLWVTILLIVAVIDLQLSYVLALLDRHEIAETLSIAIVTEIIGVIAIYMVKSFFETSNEKKHSLELKKLQISDDELEEEDDEEAVG